MLDQVAWQAQSTVRVFRSHDEFQALENEWRALEQQSRGAVLFQSFDWCRLALNSGAGGQTDDLYICTVYNGDELVALLPLKIIKKGIRKIMTGLAEPFQEFTDILILPTVRSSDMFALIEPELKKSGADYLHLGQVRRDSSLFRAMDGRIPFLGELDQAPYVEIAGWADYQTYFRSVRSQTRKNLRNQRNKLERDAPVCFVHSTSDEGLKGVIERSYANRETWLAERGLTSRAFGNTDFQGFLNQFSQGKVGDIQPISMSLMHGDTPIAEQWGLIYRNRYYAYMMGWNPDFALFSPGKMKMQEVVHHCFSLGLETAEFMIPNSAYKKTWATGTIGVQDHAKAFTPIGVVYARLWIGQLRPLVKKAVLAMPNSLRKKLSGLIRAAQ